MLANCCPCPSSCDCSPLYLGALVVKMHAIAWSVVGCREIRIGVVRTRGRRRVPKPPTRMRAAAVGEDVSFHGCRQGPSQHKEQEGDGIPFMIAVVVKRVLNESFERGQLNDWKGRDDDHQTMAWWCAAARYGVQWQAGRVE